MIGQQVGQYRIIDLLGEGAVGVVYRAEHVRLRSQVAIKFLRPELMRDDTTRERFMREAEIAATLDVPSICSVIDISDFDDSTYLVMRYCEGDSLRQRLAAGALCLERAVLYAIQIAEGLQAAHGHGVVHRDIKPSNIIIGLPDRHSNAAVAASPNASTVEFDFTGDEREQAKIIDFGLALLPDLSRRTKHGARLGTPSYMAPEQAAAQKVDNRTDLWALGAVLYEMIAGQPPFPGRDAHAVMYAIQHAKPRALRELRPEVPAKLVWIVEKALNKDPAARYQSADEMLQDLRLMRPLVEPGSGRARGSWVLEHRRTARLIGGGLVIVAALAVLLNGLRGREGNSAVMSLGQPVPVTSGVAMDREPVLSRDGGRIAYTSNAAGNRDIYVVDARGGRPLRVTNHPTNDYSPVWYPDGAQIAFVSERLEGTAIWRIGQHGGDATLLLVGARDPAISPDGEWLAYAMDDSLDHGRIGVARLGELPSCRLLTGRDDGLWGHREPAWSPDGSAICYSAKNNLWLVDPQSGEISQLTHEGREDRAPTWSADGKHIYFCSYRGNVLALWRVRVGDGSLQRLSLGAGSEGHPTVCAAGRRLAYHTDAGQETDLLLVDRPTGREARLVGEHNDTTPSLAGDASRLVFVSDRWSDRAAVWIQDLQDGQPSGEARRLTEQAGHASHPVFSPDDRWVAYYLLDGQSRDLWIVGAEGGQPQRITTHPASDVQPAWSPDGARLAFVSERGGRFGIWTVGVENGRQNGKPRPVPIGDLVAFRPIWSPDGKRIAFRADGDIWLVPADGSSVPSRLTSGAGADRLRWPAGTDRIWVSGTWGDDRYSLRTVSPEGGPPASVSPTVEFDRLVEEIFFDVSRDGRLLVITEVRMRGRIWLLDAQTSAF